MRILVIDEDNERSRVLAEALQAAGYDIVASISKDDDVRREVARFQPDMVIVDLESPYRDFVEDLIRIHEENPRPIAMFVSRDDPAVVARAIETGVSVYVAEGLDGGLVRSVLQIAVKQYREFARLNGELEKARSALRERKLLERAKGLLMTNKGLSEDEAYRLLRKMAMDQNKRIADIAENILSLADLLK